MINKYLKKYLIKKHCNDNTLQVYLAQGILVYRFNGADLCKVSNELLEKVKNESNAMAQEIEIDYYDASGWAIHDAANIVIDAYELVVKVIDDIIGDNNAS